MRFVSLMKRFRLPMTDSIHMIHVNTVFAHRQFDSFLSGVLTKPFFSLLGLSLIGFIETRSFFFSPRGESPRARYEERTGTRKRTS